MTCQSRFAGIDSITRDIDMKDITETSSPIYSEPLPKATLRDQFAMNALTGLLSDSDVDMSYEAMAEFCYKQADAMLKARG